MTPPLIGVLGASGAVGRIAADRIAQAGLHRVRLGGRDRDRVEAVAASLPAGVEVQRVDLDDPGELAAFCAGCRVVVNCAGPSYRVLDMVARASWVAGADHVDVGGELAARDALTDEPGERVAVFSAGVMPGLSGLLPRLLTGRPLRRLDSFVGGAAPFTPLSAVDALLTRGDRFGLAMAAWANGAVVPNALTPLRGVTLPGFPVPMHAWPFLTTEAQSLTADEVRAYNVFLSAEIPEALARAWAEVPVGAGADALAPYASAVVAASERDTAEHGPFYVMLFAARPAPAAPPGPSRVLLSTTDSYALSGVVMALATQAVLAGTIVPGAHLAAEVLDPTVTADALRADPLVEALTVR